MNRLVLAVCGCCLALVLAACGDDDAMSAEEYFSEVEAIGIEFDIARDAFLARADAMEDPIASARVYFADGKTAFATLMSKVDALNPPEDIKEAHDRFVDRGRALLSATEGALEELASVNTVSGLLTDFDSSAAVATFESANNASIQSCVEMEQVAADYGITVDLRCPTP